MGLETDLRKELRASRIRTAVLSTLQVGGLVGLALVAPNVAALLARSYTKREYEKTRYVLYRLVSKGLVLKREGGYELTAKGRQFLDRETLAAPKPRKWDGKWRMVIFDIPETRKAARAVLRDALRRIGFLKLQNSAWVYPYECEELVALLKTDYRLGKEVLYMIVDKLENDRALRDHFNLKR